MPLRLAILTIYNACSRDERADSSGDLIANWAKERCYTRLLVNLPGSPAGVRDGLGVLNDLLEHAVELVSGVKTSH